MNRAGSEPVFRSLTDILDALAEISRGGSVSVQDVLDEIGIRAFAPLLLVPAMILVSPLSGIPGLPTLGAVLMLLITVQKLARRDRLWLPGWLTRREIRAERLRRAVEWLRRPARWIDSHSHKRLLLLVSGPANTVTSLVITLICLIIPALEILPMVTSLFAIAISLFAIGLMARDGLFTLIGYLWAGLAAGAIYWLLPTG